MRPRRTWARHATVALVAALAFVAGACTDSTDDQGPLSTTSAGSPSGNHTILPITDAPSTYRIVYSLDDHAGADTRVTTEEVLLERPYRSRRTLWTGTDTSVAPNRTSVSDFGVLSLRSENNRDLTMSTPPVPATGDVRLEHALEELVDQGLLVPGLRRRVRGIQCQMYRTREPIGTGDLAPPSSDEWADICVDARGLVLEELWYLRGRLLQRRVAVEVEVDPDIPTGSFDAFSAQLAPDEGGGDLRAVEPTSRPNYIFWELDETPSGFVHRGRFEVLTPSGQRDVTGPSQIGPPRQAVSDVYERGSDIVVISRGSVVGREAEFELHPHQTEVDFGELGVATLELGVFGSWLRVKPDAVQFVSIRGTVSTAELLAIARDLEPSERGQLVYLEGGAA
jgi:hypothetical protein